jgi:hypothetical protein
LRRLLRLDRVLRLVGGVMDSGKRYDFGSFESIMGSLDELGRNLRRLRRLIRTLYFVCGCLVGIIIALAIR